MLITMIRFTGAPDDWKHDTINFYTGPSFVGAEFYTYGDRAWLGGRAQSVVGEISTYLHQSHYIYISTPVTSYLHIYSHTISTYLQSDYIYLSSVTGCGGWTIYSRASYRGAALCLQPSDPARCHPGFYVSTHNFGVLQGG